MCALGKLLKSTSQDVRIHDLILIILMGLLNFWELSWLMPGARKGLTVRLKVTITGISISTHLRSSQTHPVQDSCEIAVIRTIKKVTVSEYWAAIFNQWESERSRGLVWPLGWPRQPIQIAEKPWHHAFIKTKSQDVRISWPQSYWPPYAFAKFLRTVMRSVWSKVKISKPGSQCLLQVVPS